MKKVLLALLITTSGLYLSCKKDKSVPAPGEIYGKWKLTETMTDPGDGSGKYIKETGEPKYLTFDKAGKIEGNGLRAEVLSYKILDSVKLEITYKDDPKPRIIHYKVNSETLQLNPLCIEGCGFRFVRN
jgi:hypothetical protein